MSAVPTIGNRPGLTSIAYRGGSFAQLRQTMLLDIARHPELSALTTREGDDYAVTLIELFAAVGDVLNFYNERIANELFLRTAIERDSVLRMLRLIGYRLRPGLAAEAWLAFTLDNGAETFIRQGLKVMSVPGQDEKPLFFETVEKLTADWRLNALPVFVPPAPVNAFRQGATEAPLVTRPVPLSGGDSLVFFTLSGVEEKTVDAIRQARDGEHLAFSPAVQHDGVWPEVAGAAKVRRQIGFFGNAAPATYQEYRTDTAIAPQNRWITRTAGVSPYLVNFPAGTSSYPLDRKYADLKPGARLLVDRGSGAFPQMVSAGVVATEDKPATVGQLEDTVTYATLTRTVYGRQAALVGLDGTREVMGRSGVRSAMILDLSTGSDWLDLGAMPVSADPAAISPVSGQTMVFVRDNVGKLRLNIRNGASWLGWSNLGGVLTTAPAVASDTPGRVFAFARGLDLGLWVRVLTTAFLDIWRPLHGLLTSRPAPVSSGANRMDVFVRGPDRALWVKSWNGVDVGNADWDAWTSLEGTLATAPAAASTGPGNFDVVALDDDARVILRRSVAGDWQDWLDLGGEAKGEPAIVAIAGSDRVEVYVRGQDDQLWTRARSGDNWGAWTALGGVLAASPSVSHHAGTTLVAVEGQDGRLNVRVNTGAGWGGWQTPGGGLGAIADRRATRIFELVSPEVRFRDYALGDEVGGARVAARMVDAPGLETINKGRRIVLADATQQHLATVSSVQAVPSELGGANDHLLIEFTPAPATPLVEPVLKGNLANASHGETQGVHNPQSGRTTETLGNGDGTVPFQSFKLAKSPLTYRSSEINLAGIAELEIRVSNEKWTEVASLFGRKPNERVYTARQNDDGETTITFGDGKTGARVKSGAANVEASYRVGSGLAGRLKAGQLSIALERPVGLRDVTNPFPAAGGADPETRDKARAAGPASVRTFGRAVSLQDFEWLALSSPLVAKGSARWVWRGLEKAVHLTVAGERGDAFTADGLKELRAALDDARDPNRQLLLADYCALPIQVSAQVLRDPAYTKDDVERWARAALDAFFAFDAIALGQPLHASNVLAHLQAVTGVAAVDLEVFHFLDYEALTAAQLALRLATTAPVQEHLLVQPGRPRPTDPADIDPYVLACFPDGKVPGVLPAELAVVKDASTDLSVTVVEAL